MVELDKRIKEVLERFQTVAPSFVVGGFLRDSLSGIVPNDIDIATEMSIDEVKRLFPGLQGTEKGLEFGVGRFKYKGLEFEVSTYEKDEILDHTHKRDFVINSMYHDGKSLYDTYDAQLDIKKKIIRPLNPLSDQFSNKPESFVRVLRLSSHLGFSLSNDLILFLHQNSHYFFESTVNRLQLEGYKILNSKHPLKAFYYLNELKLLQGYNLFDPDMEVPILTDNIHVRFVYLASLVGIDSFYQFIDLFQLSKRIKEKTHYLLPYLSSDEKPDNPYIINEVILLKRYQYHNDPDKFRAFLMNIRNSN